MDTKDRLFIGIFPGGIVYSDRGREVAGDYARLAFLPYGSLLLEWQRKATMPPEVRAEIIAHAVTLQARRGKTFQIDACGHTVRLGN